MAKQQSPSLTAQSSSILVMLQSFIELITLHPSSFRPFVQQIQTLVLPLIAPTSSSLGSVEQSSTSSKLLHDTARRLFVLLHVCAPKNTSGEVWARSLSMIIILAQRTADRIFRSLIEDWRPRSDMINGAGLAMNETVSDAKPQPLNLPGWTGIHDGVQRLNGLLCTIQAFVSLPSSAAVVLQVSSIMNLTDRILSILQPSGARGSRLRPDIGRDEREGLLIGLPQLHVSAMAILSLLISRMGSSCAATKESTLEQVSWVFQNECANDEVRTAAYEIVSQILKRFGLSLGASCTAPISLCIRACCEDLVSPGEAAAQDRDVPALHGTKPSDHNSSSTNADSFLKGSETRLKTCTVSEHTVQAAGKLLPLALTSLPSEFLSYALRTRVDRTAILANNKTAMLASVMNPYIAAKGKHSSVSILPLLARAHLGALEIEALLRPQMPTVQLRRKTDESEILEEEENSQAYDRGSQNRLRPYAFGFGSEQFGDRILEGGSSRALTSDDPDEAEETSMTTTGGTDTAQSGLPMLEPQASHVPKKRDREIGAPLKAETVTTHGAKATESMQTEEVIWNKRARLTDSEAEQYQEKTVKVDPQVSNNATSMPSGTQASTAVGAKYLDDPVDSDESDFEMPTLYMNSDSDEEDEGEEMDDE